MLQSGRANWILMIIALWAAFTLPLLPRHKSVKDVSTELPASDPFEISGIVVDPGNGQVADAHVWLHAQARLRRAERVVLAQADTDTDGRFTVVASSQVLASGIDLRAVAVGQDGRIGWWEQFAGQVPRQLEIRLQGVTTFSGQVLSSTGQPASRVRIVPRTAVIDEDGLEHFHHLPPELSKRLAATTDAQGKFAISGVPQATYLFLDIEAGVSGRLSCQAQTSQPVSIRIPALGKLSGRFVWKDATRKPFEAAEVELFKDCCPASPEPGQALLSFSADTRIKSDGTFEFARVPVGEYFVQVAPGQRQFVGPKAFPVMITDQASFTHVEIPVLSSQEPAKALAKPEVHFPRSVFDPVPLK